MSGGSFGGSPTEKETIARLLYDTNPFDLDVDIRVFAHIAVSLKRIADVLESGTLAVETVQKGEGEA